MNNGDAPAAPISEEETDRIDGSVKIYTGLTKREAFAMAAMQGLIPATIDLGECYDDQASHAVEMANALLKALEESQ